MADYKTNVQGGPSGYQGVSPITEQGGGQNKLSSFEGLVTSFITGAAKGSARRAGKQLSGVDKSAQDIQGSVNLFDEAMNPGPQEDKSQAEMADLRKKSISEVASTRAELDALIGANKISSTEAKARMDQLLSEKLANPFLAMFEDDLVNQATNYTGGSGSQAAGFGMSLDEQRAAARKESDTAAFKKMSDTSAELQRQTGMSAEQADNVANKGFATLGENERMTAALENGQIKDKGDIETAIRASQSNIYIGLDGIRLTPGNFDTEGGLTVAGEQAWDEYLAKSYERLSGAIRTSNLNDEGRKEQMNNLRDQMANLQALKKSMSTGEFMKLQAASSSNWLSADMSRRMPLVQALQLAGNQDAANMVLLGGPAADKLLATLNLDKSKFDNLKKGTMFDKFMGGTSVVPPFNPKDLTQEDVIINNLDSQGQAFAANELTKDNPAAVAAREANRRYTAINTPSIVVNNANTRLMVHGKGDEADAQREVYRNAYNNIRAEITAVGAIPEGGTWRDVDVGRIGEDGLRSFGLDWGDATGYRFIGPPGTEAFAEHVSLMLGPLVKFPHLWNKKYATQLEALNAAHRGEFDPFAELDSVKKTPPLADRAPASSNRKMTEAAEGRMAGLSDAQLESAIAELESTTTKTVVNTKTLNSLRKEQEDRANRGGN